MVPPLPEHLTCEDGYACFRPVVEVDMAGAIELIDAAIGFCRNSDITGLLIDVRQLTGFQPPTTTDRFWFIKKWADTAAGKVTVSMISRPELMDPEKIGVTMALNRGFNAEVFTDEADAIEWLRSELRPGK
jgi:hypothetical protein